MCGISGFVDPGGDSSRERLKSVAACMAGTLTHRGPDDGGTWVDEDLRLGFGHRRLAVVDLSSDGHQPMSSADGRYVLNFNGEIYNHKALRDELASAGVVFRGSSDTEVLVEAIARWGARSALDRVNGMFAFAVLDRRERRLVLARDRMGEKPLYYGWVGHTLMFASELKSLRVHPDFSAVVDPEAVILLLRLGYIPAPFSIYRGISKLPAGTFLDVALDRADRSTTRPQAYWSVEHAARHGLDNPLPGSDLEVTDHVNDLLASSVGLRMVADVPVGAFLSGGIDSSLIVSLMQQQARGSVRTFSIGFEEAAFDEAPHARAVAHHLGTDHTEMYVTAREAQAVIPELPGLYDEPFADSSQIPTYLVARLARRDVTVTLSGDGGDELFAGYDRFVFHRGMGRRLASVPPLMRRPLARALAGVPPERWNALFGRYGRLLPPSLRQRRPGERLHKLARVLSLDTREEVYLSMVSLWQQPASVVRGGAEPPTLLTDPSRWLDVGDFTERLLHLDMATYLPEDLLTKVDRATMAVSLEARVPFLDHRVVELAWRVPLNMKVRDGRGKWLLRQVLSRYVPPELFERPKMGFAVPVGDWLRGPLRAWAGDLLSPDQLRAEGFLDPHPVQQAWNEHLSGARDRTHELWAVLMFQAWHDTYAGVGPGKAA